jgi:DNA-binding NarL/FixJ family response regulator
VRVLIVNDAAVECDALTRLLGSLGHEVVARAADSGDAAVIAGRLLPDLALVDGRLPPGGCLPAIPILRAAAPAMRVAIVAAVSEIELVRAAVAAGAAGALRRPLLRSQVVPALEDILAHRA